MSATGDYCWKYELHNRCDSFSLMIMFNMSKELPHNEIFYKTLDSIQFFFFWQVKRSFIYLNFRIVVAPGKRQTSCVFMSVISKGYSFCEVLWTCLFCSLLFIDLRCLYCCALKTNIYPLIPYAPHTPGTRTLRRQTVRRQDSSLTECFADRGVGH